MNDFMQHDFNIKKILLSCYVGKGMGVSLHKDRPGHGLAFHTGGVKTYLFDNGKTITAGVNDIIYLPKHSNYEVTSREIGACYAINFDVSEEIAFSPFKIKMKNSLSVIEYFKSAKNAWDKKDCGYIMKCKGDLYQIISSMQQEYFADYLSKSKLDIIKPAVEYIHSKYTTQLITISELSDMCGITPEYFRKIFKAFYGTSPLRYINMLKISHAKELIESGMYSVTEAALQSGYTNLNHFSREFKKETGICPKNYLHF